MEEAVEVRLHRDVEDFFAECSELVFRNLAQSQVVLGQVAKPTEVLSSPRALPTQSPLDQAQVKQLFSFHGPRARGVLVLSPWPPRPELYLMMAGEVKEAWVAEALSMVHPELTRMITTAYGPQEVIEEAARALQKLRPAISWNLELVVTCMELLSPYPEVGDPPAGQMLRVLPVKEAPFQAVPAGLCNEVLLADEAVVEKLTDYYVAFKQDSGISDPNETRESHRQTIEDLVATCEVYVWQVGTDIAAISAAARALADVGRGITMVYTSPPHRRRGYAAALITKIGAALTKQGLRTCITANARGSHGAERLYARIGFVKQGQVQQVRFSGPEPEPCA
mmetsp:Transcript_21932/g.52045  ORF Transcript_21932/g.52045 Transcript_21932/m.52045 type:complete len:338 (+) Transcript_21932:57-1070(+)|eukprot:CAMPEP_0181408064 /NCGR_PEP_ID=MMETSP1110-20121109/6102_1 /TAXON_ID=174948 /ORGANISM="Symbiodinium sp., Strain CCMP421" /LENGTH=337 /DNA_ID=CAMNT_0023530511 /DNA_START=56 /DNA_END=1069 /DNA_ORIENTATION=-